MNAKKDSNTKKDSKGRNLKENEDQLKDGRYRYRYTDKYGERHSEYAWKLVPTDKTPKGKKETLSLREKEKQIEKDIDDDIELNVCLTVEELVRRYIDTKPKLADSTKNNYIHLLEKNIAPNKFGQIRINCVKKSDVLKFYSHLYKDKKFKVGTIQLYQNLLFPAFQMAVEDTMIRLNPCKNCMKDYVRGGLSSTKYPLTRDEQSELLNFVKKDNIYSVYYTLIAFMLSTGCRIGEALGITWDDIDFDKKYISINHQIIYKKKENKVQFYSELPKNRTDRIVPIKDDIIQILKEHKSKTYFISISSGFSVDGYKNFVFINSKEKLYTPNTIVRTFHGIRDAYNKIEKDKAYEERRDPKFIRDFSPHTLRHTYCTRMAENGCDVKVLQEIMGHKTISVTMQVYNHVTIDRSINAIKEVTSPLQNEEKVC